MGDYVTSKSMQHRDALTGVARQQAEKAEKEAEEYHRLEAELEELKLEQAIAKELEKSNKAKSKRKSSGKSRK